MGTEVWKGSPRSFGRRGKEGFLEEGLSELSLQELVDMSLWDRRKGVSGQGIHRRKPDQGTEEPGDLCWGLRIRSVLVDCKDKILQGPNLKNSRLESGRKK